MKFEQTNDTIFRLELSRRNLETLLAKLDDPHSARSLVKGIEPDDSAWIMVNAVEDEVHYSDRPAGQVYMPSTGETK